MKIRVILDTNLWISYLISKKLSKVDALFDRDDLVLLFSAELIEELIEAATHPKLRKYFFFKDLEELLGLFDLYGEIVNVTSTVNKCRDAKDNFLLALARDSIADFLITGDRDLLVLKKFEETEILNYSDFETRILSP